MIIEDRDRLRRFLEEGKIKNFVVAEFVCKHCGEVKIDTELVLILQRLRDFLNKPVVITSAYRCPEYNREIGGVPGSAHTKGLTTAS